MGINSPETDGAAHAQRPQSALTLWAILSRFMLFLALALFGALNTGVDEVAAKTSPAAVMTAASSPAILTGESHLPRGQAPRDDSPYITPPASIVPAPMEAGVATVSWEYEPPLAPDAIDLLPPARGPPEV